VPLLGIVHDPKDDLTWSELGNNFRVIAHVALWSTDQALSVPVTALFRKGDDWAVFALRDGRARATPVEIGHRNERSAEIWSGLVEGDQVVLHPSDRITDGTAVAQRSGLILINDWS
jgi:HlyD family secretion protein